MAVAVSAAGCLLCGRATGQFHRPTCAHAGRPVAGDEPVARRTDSPTSHAAARSARASAGEIRGRVLESLRIAARDEAMVGMTDEELVRWFAQRGWSGTPSGIRTRRRELVDEEPPMAVDTGRTRPTATGRKSIVWAIRPAPHKGGTK